MIADFGTAAWARSDLICWGVLGVLVGAISGAFGGRILEGGVVTGIAWGVFRLVAGAPYGCFAGRGISTGRIMGLGPFHALMSNSGPPGFHLMTKPTGRHKRGAPPSRRGRGAS